MIQSALPYQNSESNASKMRFGYRNPADAERYCHADFGKLKQVADWAAKYQKFWTEKLDALGAFLEGEEQQQKGNSICLLN